MSGPTIPPHPTIYLLPSRPWLHELGVADLAGVPDEALDHVCGGTDVVWLQGVWELGPAGRVHDLADPGRRRHFEECLPGDFAEDDCIGSPYAVARYALNPALGSGSDLAALRERLAQRGTALMLDFVPNHTARDSPWVKDHPGVYVAGGSGAPAFGRDPYSGDWTDTAQLNYWSRECCEHMVLALLSVAEVCDGVRVDMAMLCCSPVIERTWGDQLRSAGFGPPEAEFWPWAVDRVRARHPSFFLLAECYEYEQIFPDGTGRHMLQQGFDAVYDKTMYDRLAEGHLDHVREHLGEPLLPEGRLCHFTENHDEPRAAAHFGAARSLAAAAATLTLPGPRLVMWGQEFGLRGRLAVHLRRGPPEEHDPTAEAFHARLLAALPSCRGTWAPCSVGGSGAWRLLAWGWRGEDTSVMVAVNFTEEEAWAEIQVADLMAGRGGGSGHLCLTDLLTGETYDRDATEILGPGGLTIGLRPFQAHMLLCRRP